MAEVEFRKGTGPDQLPQGAAKGLNDQVTQNNELKDAQPSQFADFGPPKGVELAGPDEQGVTALSGQDARLYGPTARPNEHITAGATGRGKLQAPPDIHAWLPSLVAAASMPDASENLHNLLNLITYHLGN